MFPPFIETYGVPRRTLTRHAKDVVRKAGTMKMGALEPVFCGKLEEKLVKHVKAMEAAMFFLSLTYLRRLEFDIAVRADITHPFDAANK